MICERDPDGLDSRFPKRTIQPSTSANDDKQSLAGSTSSEGSVRFSSLEIREYPVRLGDNPACTNGPALTLGWCFQQALFMSVDKYEELRPPRRFNNEIRIPCRLREDMLMNEWGYSMSDIVCAVIEKRRVQMQRKNSAKDRVIYLPKGVITIPSMKGIAAKVRCKFSFKRSSRASPMRISEE
mmetsp:Transcript_40275/g.59191  ORF Transcript_40275/g.59191 Transcript_40275/m.59191 type:complete len:183 (+) Transcript_40275:37-585(+)